MIYLSSGMFIYSQNIQLFIKRSLKLTREILKDELGLEVRRTRFLFRRHWYPLNLVAFERPRPLAYFDYSCYQIGLNKVLMYSVKTPVLKNILRHELAHFLSYLEYGHTDKDHGPEFKSVCRKYANPESVQKAYIDLELENNQIEGDLKTEKIINKISKILSLSNSSNEHESKLATAKANEYLLKYQLQNINNQEGPVVYVKRVLTFKRTTGKYQAIYSILKKFMVAPVFNYTKGSVYLEVTGSKANVEVADYVADVLEKELERLWKINQKEHGIKGISAKNSFMNSLAKSYIQTMHEIQSEQFSQNQLISLGKDLDESIKIAYGRVRYSQTYSGKYDEKASKLGAKAGKNLKLNKAMSSQTKSIMLLE